MAVLWCWQEWLFREERGQTVYNGHDFNHRGICQTHLFLWNLKTKISYTWNISLWHIFKLHQAMRGSLIFIDNFFLLYNDRLCTGNTLPIILGSCVIMLENHFRNLSLESSCLKACQKACQKTCLKACQKVCQKVCWQPPPIN